MQAQQARVIGWRDLSRVPLWSLEEFHERCKLLLEEKEELVHAGRSEMRGLLPQVLATQEAPYLTGSDEEMLLQFALRAALVFEAEEWLEKHRHAYGSIVAAEPGAIDLNYVPVTEVWLEFTDTMRPQWEQALYEYRALVRACGWEEADEPPEEARELAVDLPDDVPHKGVPDSAFHRNEDGSVALSLLPGSDYYDQEEEEDDDQDELDDDFYADQEDLKFSIASPRDGDAALSAGAPPIEPPQAAPSGPRPFRLSPSVGSTWRSLFEMIVPQVFQEFGVDEGVGRSLMTMPHDALVDEHSAPDEEDVRRLVAEVQAAILEAFNWAITHRVEDAEAILAEVRGAMSEAPPPHLNEFTHRSNGHSRFLHAQINYNGSWDNGEALSDGYTIESARKATRSHADE